MNHVECPLQNIVTSLKDRCCDLDVSSLDGESEYIEDDTTVFDSTRVS